MDRIKQTTKTILGPNKTKDRKTDMINLNLMTYALLPWFHKTKEDYDDYIGEGISLTEVNFKTKW